MSRRGQPAPAGGRAVGGVRDGPRRGDRRGRRRAAGRRGLDRLVRPDGPDPLARRPTAPPGRRPATPRPPSPEDEPHPVPRRKVSGADGEDLMESQRIAGRYLVLRAIGRGGMGVVWLCRDEVLGREVAVKQIGGLPGEPEVETMRAMREARSAAALNHPNVVAVYDVVNHDGRPWLVMEYVDGQTLAEILADEGPPAAAAGGRHRCPAGRRPGPRPRARDRAPRRQARQRAGRPGRAPQGQRLRHRPRARRRPADPDRLRVRHARLPLTRARPRWRPRPRLGRLGPGRHLVRRGGGPAAVRGRSNPLALLREIATEPPRPMQHAGALAPAIAAMMDQDPARRWDMATAARRLGEISRGDTSLLEATQVSATQGDSTQLLTTAAPLEATQRMAVPAAAPAATAHRPGRAEPCAGPGRRRRGATAGAHRPPPRRAGGPSPAGGCRWCSSSSCWPRSAPTWSARWARTRQARHARGTGTPTAPRHASGRRRAEPVHAPARRAAPPRAAPRRPPRRPAARRPDDEQHAEQQAPTTSTPSTSPTSAAGGVAGGDKALAGFVTSYFADVTKDRDRTWRLLTPAMQDAAGGRSGYDGFWGSIASVRTAQTRADAQGKEADVTLTYTRDGRHDLDREAPAHLRDQGRWLPHRQRPRGALAGRSPGRAVAGRVHTCCRVAVLAGVPPPH